jgi:hypothetical protein
MFWFSVEEGVSYIAEHLTSIKFHIIFIRIHNVTCLGKADSLIVGTEV